MRPSSPVKKKKPFAPGARPVPRYIERSARVLEFVHTKGLLPELAKALEV